MNTQDHAERACAMRDNRNIKQRKIASSELAPTRINSAPIGEEPREQYQAGIASRAVTKTSIAMPAEKSYYKWASGVINQRRTHKCSHYRVAGKRGH